MSSLDNTLIGLRLTQGFFFLCPLQIMCILSKCTALRACQSDTHSQAECSGAWLVVRWRDFSFISREMGCLVYVTEAVLRIPKGHIVLQIVSEMAPILSRCFDQLSWIVCRGNSNWISFMWKTLKILTERVRIFTLISKVLTHWRIGFFTSESTYFRIHDSTYFLRYYQAAFGHRNGFLGANFVKFP